jgi:hypothetical protein
MFGLWRRAAGNEEDEQENRRCGDPIKQLHGLNIARTSQSVTSANSPNVVERAMV